MQKVNLEKWIERLKTIGLPWAALPALGERFCDEAGATRPVDIPFFAWRKCCAGNPCIAPDDCAKSPEVQLWRALTDKRVHVDDIVAQCLTDADDRDSCDAGALISQHGILALEAWTEMELASLHALFWHGHAQGRADLAALTDRIAQWHMENLQPDNATNRPWGVPMFVWRAVMHDDVTAGLYAETLIHNCQVALGHVDALSAHILMDAADALNTALTQTAGGQS